MATNSEFLDRLRSVSVTLATLEAEIGRCIHEIEVLTDIASCTDERWKSGVRREAICIGPFIIDSATFSVSNGDRFCDLGNTVCFRFLECLARSPNQCFTSEELLKQVWDGQRRTPTAVRSALFELRTRLRDAGLYELANALRAEGRAYRLMFGD